MNFNEFSDNVILFLYNIKSIMLMVNFNDFVLELVYFCGILFSNVFFIQFILY